MDVINLRVIPATPANVAPFGSLLGVPDVSAGSLPIAFYEGSVEIFKPCDFVSDADTELTVAKINRRPPDVQWLERHFKHTQTFIPLSAKQFVMVLAPPTDGDLPNVADAVALRFDGTAGFCMNIGVWHEFPFAVNEDTRIVVILRGEATQSLMKDVVQDGEAHSDDLDKKDIQRRLGVVLRPAL